MIVPPQRAVFKKRYRLQTPAQYRNLYRTGDRGRTRYFAWRTTPNELSYSRLGLAVSKKHLRKAVDRNLVRRLIRESFRQQSMCGVDVLVILIAAPDLRSRHELVSDLRRLWHQVARSVGNKDKTTPAPLDAAGH